MQSRTIRFYSDSKMDWCKILIITAAFLAGNTNALSIKPRILNGVDGDIQKFPYQVSIRFLNKHYCGGSIITEKHILTAAHCIHAGMTAPYYTVVTGTSYRLFGGSHHEIADATKHPDVQCNDNRCTQDIAVITLKKVIDFNKKQQKIKLTEKNYEVGSKAIVTGWGLVEQMPSVHLADKLQMLETNLISMEECQKKVINPEQTKILETEICAFHSTGTGACAGDSGGPLVVDGELVGVVAWVDGDQCAIGRPDVFTNVYKYLDFIKSITNQSV